MKPGDRRKSNLPPEMLKNGGPRPFVKGDPRINPGGRPTIQKDLERAGAIDPGLPKTPAEARAKWWAMLLPVAFAGPQSAKDSNWTYASAEVGVRLLGKPKETVEVLDGNQTQERETDWSRVPLDVRERLLAVQRELEQHLAEQPEPEDAPVTVTVDGGTTEH